MVYEGVITSSKNENLKVSVMELRIDFAAENTRYIFFFFFFFLLLNSVLQYTALPLSQVHLII